VAVAQQPSLAYSNAHRIMRNLLLVTLAAAGAVAAPAAAQAPASTVTFRGNGGTFAPGFYTNFAFSGDPRCRSPGSPTSRCD
jgi:hypothetical protein